MEMLTNKGLLVNVPITGSIADDSSKDTSEDSSPQSDSSSATSAVSSGASGCGSSLTHSSSSVDRRKDSKWGKG